MTRRASYDDGRYDGETAKRRNIVLSYRRDGKTEVNAEICADQLLSAMERWKAAIALSALEKTP